MISNEYAFPQWFWTNGVGGLQVAGPLAGRPCAMLIGDSITSMLDCYGPIGGMYQMNCGYPGARPVEIVPRASAMINPLNPFWPKIVDTMMGTNLVGIAVALPGDEEWCSVGTSFQSLIGNWMTGTKLWTPRTVVSTIPPWNADRAYYKPGWEAINNIIRFEAIRTGTMLIDVHAEFTGTDGFAKPGLLLDGIHPSKAGCDLLVSLKTAAYATLLQQYPL